MPTTNEPEMPVCPYCKGNGLVGEEDALRLCPMCKGKRFFVSERPAVSKLLRLNMAATILAGIVGGQFAPATTDESYEEIANDALALADKLIEKIYGWKND